MCFVRKRERDGEAERETETQCEGERLSKERFREREREVSKRLGRILQQKKIVFDGYSGIIFDGNVGAMIGPV